MNNSVLRERFEKIISEQSEHSEILLPKDRNDSYLNSKIQIQYEWFRDGWNDHDLAIRERIYTNAHGQNLTESKTYGKPAKIYGNAKIF